MSMRADLAIAIALAGGALAVGTFAGCGPDRSAHEFAVTLSGGGQPDSGRVLLRRYGCGTCHVIPGVEGARGVVGPPLDHLRDRAFVAGVLLPTPENLMRWIERPRAIDSATAMPDLGVTRNESRHMVAYLYSIGALP